MTQDAAVVGSRLPFVALILLVCGGGLFALTTYAWQPELVLAGLVATVASACLLLLELVRT